jgi:hypothetical protein
MLRDCSDSSPSATEPNSIIDNLAGIVLFGTPHHGSFWASTAALFGKVLRTTLSVQDLQRGDLHLANLVHWFRSFVVNHKVPLLAYSETKPLWGIGLVVDRVSADPGIPGLVPVPLESDHVDMCKCQTTDALSYQGVCKFVRDRLADCRPITAQPIAEGGLSVHLGLDDVPLRHGSSVFTADRDLTLSYKLDRTAAPTRIYAFLPYLDDLKCGGPIKGRTFKTMPIAPSFPGLDFKIANNWSKTVFISEAEFAVKYSRPLRHPVLIFRDRSAYSFEIRNEGAGPAINVQLRFTFAPSGEMPVFSSDHRHIIDVGNIEDHIIVDLEEEMDKACGQYAADLVRRIEEAATRDNVITAVGEMAWSESPGGARISCRFVTDVYVGPIRYGMPGPPSYIYDLQLRADGTSYMETVPVSQVIEAGATDRFQIALYCDAPAEHHFTINLKSTEAVVLSAEIALETFMPRSRFAIIRSRNSMGTDRLPFQAKEP